MIKAIPAEIAKLATKRAIGEVLKPAEKSRLARSKFGAQVAKELVPENAAKGKLVDAMTRPGKYKPLDTRVEADVSNRVSESGKNELADSGAEFDLKQVDAKTGSDGKLIVKLAMFVIPLIMIVVGYIVYLKKYKISEEYYDRILADLESRES